MPFQTWAQPKYLERRKQAVAVWYGLLDLLAFAWTVHGREERLREAGFEPSGEFIDLIDDLHLYAIIQDRFRPRKSVVVETVEAFFLRAISDPSPTVRTNPLLWWVAVLVHGDVLQQHQRLPIHMPGSPDTLALPDKLQALEHYSRVLVMNDTFKRWVTESSPNAMSPAGPHQQEGGRWVEQTDVAWVDADMDEPAADAPRAEPDLGSPAWEDWHKTLRKAAETWLMWNSEGPLREILTLRASAMPLARPQQVPAAVAPRTRYQIKYSITHNWQTDPGSYTPNPHTHDKVFTTLAEANDAVYDVALQQLRTALDYEDGDKSIELLAEESGMEDDWKWFAEGHPGMRDHTSTHDRVGRIRYRALFCDADDECTKIVAWVEDV